MSDDDDKTRRELIAALQEPVPPVPPCRSELEGAPSPVGGVVNEYSFGLVIRRDGMEPGSYDLISGGKTWSQHVAGYTTTLIGLLTLILSIEDGTLGGVFINKNHISNKTEYFAVVDAIARTLVPGAEKKDRDLVKTIKYGTCPSQYINLTHQRDIKEAKRRIEDEVKKKEQSKNNKNNQAEDVPAHAPAPAAQVDLVDALFEAGAEPSPAAFDDHVDDVLSQFTHLMCHNRPPHVHGRSDLIGPMTAQDTVMETGAYFINLNKAVVNPVGGNDNPQQGSLMDDLFNMVDSVGAQGLPKATMHVSVIRDREQPTVVTGYLVRIFQYDPAWNPGVTVHKLSEECNQRMLHKFNAHFKDPRPNYVAMQESQFPTADMSWSKWIKMCKRYNYQGRDTFQDTIEDNAMTQRADDYSSRYHPTQVFTLERALERLRDAGGHVGEVDDYLGEFRGAKVRVWPEYVRQQTVTYLPEQVFWDHPTNVGLLGQYFPFQHTSEPAIRSLFEDCTVVSKKAVLAVTPRFSGFKTFNVLIHKETATQDSKEEANLLFKQCGDIHRLFKAGRETRQWKEYREYVRMTQRKNMQDFAAICTMDGDVDYQSISRPMKACLKYLQDNRDTATFDVFLEDPEVGFFGNAVIRQLMQYEKVLKVMRTMIAYKVEGLFSVYRGLDADLRFNYILYGEKGEGKSVSGPKFVDKICVPGTTTAIDRKTGASEQTDMGIYDEIQIQEEMDEVLVNPEVGKKNPEKVNMHKKALTGKSVKIRTFQTFTIPGYGERRGARDIETHWNYVTCGSTNEPDIDAGALASRFHTDTITQSLIPTNELGFDVDTADKREIVQYFRMVQSVIGWTEKAMATHAIHRAVNMELWHKVSDHMFASLNRWGIMEQSDNARVKEKMTMFARVETVKKMYILGYCIAGAPFHGQPFHPEHLLELQRYLYCDTDIIIFTWTALSTEIVNDKYGKILNAAFKVATGCPENWQRNMTTYKLYQNDTVGRLKWRTETNPMWVKERDGPNRNRKCIDLTYMSIEGNLDRVARSISSHTEYSANDVKGALKGMSRISLPLTAGGRNGYAPIPEVTLERHRGIERHKTVLLLDTMANTVMTYCSTMAKTMIRDVVMHITGVDPKCYESPKACRNFLDLYKLDAEDVVFLHCMLGQWSCTEQELQYTLLELRNREVPMETLRRILLSVDHVTLFNDVEFRQVQQRHNLTYQRCTIICHGFDTERFYEAGSPNRMYVEKTMEDEDALGGTFARYVSEDDIPMLLGIPVRSRFATNNNVTPLVDLSEKKFFYFCPLFIDHFDKTVILEAFEHAVMCGTTRPGKRLLGWSHDEDQSKAQVLNWTQEYIDETIRKLNAMAPLGENRLNGVVFRERKHVNEAANVILRSKTSTQGSNIVIIHDLDEWAAEMQHLYCGFDFDDPVRTPTYIHNKYIAAGGHVGRTNYPATILEEESRDRSRNWEPNTIAKRLRVE